MSTVAEIIDAVKQLNDDEKDQFLDKLREVEFEDAWDRQMGTDAKAGKLDFLVREADEAIRDSKLRDRPGDSAKSSRSPPRSSGSTMPRFRQQSGGSPTGRI